MFWKQEKNRKKETNDKNIKWIKASGVQIAKIFSLFPYDILSSQGCSLAGSSFTFSFVFSVILNKVGLGEPKAETYL